MEEGNIHDVVAVALTTDPWYNCLGGKVLLVKRKSREQGEDYWPGMWYVITEHREQGENSVDTAKRGLEEELGLSFPEDFMFIRGPAILHFQDPDHHDRFRVLLYQCSLRDIERRSVPFNDLENEKYTWANHYRGGLRRYLDLMRATFIDGLHGHLDELFFLSPYTVDGIEAEKINFQQLS